MDSIVAKILDSYQLLERLKSELRHSWLSSGRQESVAEHTWQMGLLACMVAPWLKQQVDLGRVLKMILVHDLAEAVTGDIPYFEQSERQNQKAEAEKRAMERIEGRLPAPFAAEAVALWHEFEARQTPEAMLAAALDYVEVQMQHNLAAFSSWEPVEYDLVFRKMITRCEHEPILQQLRLAVEEQASQKLRSHGVDVDQLKLRNGRGGTEAARKPVS